jgi:multicomponent Na+:H+ antiporter subunit D
VDAILPIAVMVPLIAAALVTAVGHLAPRWAADVVTIGAASATAVLCAIVMVRAGNGLRIHWFGGWTPRSGFALGIDFVAGRLAAAAATFVAVLATVAAVFSWRYLETAGTKFHALLLVFCAAMVGFCLTGDIFNMFVFFELMSVSAYALTALTRDERGPLQGALNFAITNSIGAFLVLFGIALLYGRTHALNLEQLGRALGGSGASGTVVCALTFITAGFLVKAAAVPFHFWLADAHTVAPAPICILFSGIMVELGLLGIARVYWSVFSGVIPPSNGLRTVLITIGVLTALVGAAMCLGQHHLKRLLALSTVSHSGLALIGVGLLDRSGLAGFCIYVVGHGLVKGALFACTGILLHRKGKVDDQHLFGAARDMPFTALLWFVGALALAGLPPFATYVGKGVIDEAAHQRGAGWLLLVGVVASAVTGAAVLRAGAHVFLGWGDVESDPTSARHGSEQRADTLEGHERTPAVMYLAATALLVASLAFGVLPRLIDRADTAAEQFVDRAGNAAAVLDGVPRLVSHPSPSRGPTASMLVSGAAAAALAVAIAAVAIWRRRIPEGARRPFARAVMPPIRLLRTMHSGHVGDYIAWLTFATAALGGAFALVAAR